MGTDTDGHLITASADLSKEQKRIPANPEKPESEFDLSMPDFYFRQLISVDPAGAAQVERVKQYKDDVQAVRPSMSNPSK